jgi:hypothetical protein
MADVDELTEDELLLQDLDEMFAFDLQEMMGDFAPRGRMPFTKKLSKEELVLRLLTMTEEEWQADLERIVLIEDENERNKAQAEWFANHAKVLAAKTSMQFGMPIDIGSIP